MTRRYAERVDRSDEEQREALLTELAQLRSDLEKSFVPEMVEPVLSLRLTMQQLKVLTILVTEPEGSTIRALAETMDVSLATMSGIVDRLELQEMITRALDPHDQRVRRVAVSSTGRRTIQRLLVARPELRHAPLKKLALDDLRALAQGVRALMTVMQDGEPD